MKEKKISPKKRVSVNKNGSQEAIEVEPIHDSTHHNDVLDMILQQSGNRDKAFFADPPTHFEGQLAIDMGETKDTLVIVSTIAGATPSDISIHIDGDMLTIRGKRASSFGGADRDYFYKECYWGWFSRSIVLPVDVRGDDAVAQFKNGLLTITIPKTTVRREVPIVIIDEE